METANIIKSQNLIRELGLLEIFFKIAMLIVERLRLTSQKNSKIQRSEEIFKFERSKVQEIASVHLEPIIKKLYGVITLCIKSNGQSGQFIEKYIGFLNEQLK